MKSLIFSFCFITVLVSCGNAPLVTLKGSSQTLTTTAVGTANPSSVQIQIKTLWLSTSLDCSNPQKVFDESNPTVKDLFANPTFGSGGIPSGTYVCAIIKMSDLLTFFPATNAGNYCKAGVATTVDLFGGGSSSTDVCPDGNVAGHGTSSNPIEDWMCITFTTEGISSYGNIAGRGASSSVSLKLASPVKINSNITSGDTTLTLGWDLTNQVSDSVSPGATSCALDPGTISLQ